MSDSSTIQQIAVSYAWKAEEGGVHAGMVEDLCHQLRAAGVKVLRDVDGAKPGDNLNDFMRSIGNSNVVCIFLSDAYLRSPNCMYELLVAWQTCKNEPGKFRQKVRVWVLDDAKGIYDSAGRDAYLGFWKKQRDTEEELVKQNAIDGLSPKGLAKYRRMKEFCEQLDGILNTLADTLLVEKWEALSDWLKKDVPAINGPTEAQISAVFQETLNAMDYALLESEAVAKFLSLHSAGLVVQEGQLYRMADKARRPPIDVVTPLDRLEKRLRTEIKRFQASDLDQLELLCGGIMVLGVDPRWIWEQRNLAEAALRYPGWRATVTVEGGDADFLHVVTAAMADGCARLRRIFMEKPRTKVENRALPPPPEVLPATDAEDEEIELMAHFVNNLASTKVDVAKPMEVTLAFAQIRANMRFESVRRHNPFHGSEFAFFEYAGRIRKFLNPQDFLIIGPSGDKSEDQLLPESVFALRYLQDIHEHIKARRNQLLTAP